MPKTFSIGPCFRHDELVNNTQSLNEEWRRKQAICIGKCMAIFDWALRSFMNPAQRERNSAQYNNLTPLWLCPLHRIEFIIKPFNTYIHLHTISAAKHSHSKGICLDGFAACKSGQNKCASFLHVVSCVSPNSKRVYSSYVQFIMCTIDIVP